MNTQIKTPVKNLPTKGDKRTAINQKVVNQLNKKIDSESFSGWTCISSLKFYVDLHGQICLKFDQVLDNLVEMEDLESVKEVYQAACELLEDVVSDITEALTERIALENE